MINQNEVHHVSLVLSMLKPKSAQNTKLTKTLKGALSWAIFNKMMV